MQLIKSEAHSAGQVMFTLPEAPAGKGYAGLVVRLAGTNDTGQTLAITELGTLRLNHEGVEIINSRPSSFIYLTNLYYGVPENASAEAGAYTFSFFVPFRTKTDETNILPVRTNRTSFVLQGFNTAKVASGTIEVYAIYSEGVAKYVPLWKENNTSFSGAQTKQVDFTDPFIEQLYAIDSANISTLQVTRDGAPVVDGTFAAIDAASDIFNKVETGIDLVELIAPKSPFLQNVRSTAMKITATGSITEQVIFYMAAFPYPSE